MIEPTDEMAKVFGDAWEATEPIPGARLRAALTAVLAIVERDYILEPVCGAIYVDPRGKDRRPVAPCRKERDHENGPETDWKRGFHSNGMFKWPVEP